MSERSVKFELGSNTFKNCTFEDCTLNGVPIVGVTDELDINEIVSGAKEKIDCGAPCLIAVIEHDTWKEISTRVPYDGSHWDALSAQRGYPFLCRIGIFFDIDGPIQCWSYIPCGGTEYAHRPRTLQKPQDAVRHEKDEGLGEMLEAIQKMQKVLPIWDRYWTGRREAICVTIPELAQVWDDESVVTLTTAALGEMLKRLKTNTLNQRHTDVVADDVEGLEHVWKLAKGKRTNIMFYNGRLTGRGQDGEVIIPEQIREIITRVGGGANA